jgi:GTP-binding protein EngB required for normal cell division
VDTSTTEPLVAKETEALLATERALLDRVAALAAAIRPGSDAAAAAELLRRHLEEPFLLVVVGEVKAGKSSFLNALLGTPACAVGPTPLTDRITVLRWGPVPAERTVEEFLIERDLDIELLREVSLVDTPGTNSILRQHSTLTERFIPRADLVLFLTSIDRPYSESEDRFLALVAEQWRKKVVFLLTKIDGRERADVEQVVAFVRRSVVERQRFEPVVLPISVKLERDGVDGGLAAVREHVRKALAAGEKMRLKLESPAASAQALVAQLAETLEQDSGTLDRDFRAVQDLERQVEQASSDLKEKAHRFLTETQELFDACEARAEQFFDQHARLKALAFGKGEGPLRDRFEREVLAELQAKYAAASQQATDWLTREEITLHERATQFVNERLRGLDAARTLPTEPARFEYRRDQLFASIADAFSRESAALDLGGESRRFLEQAETGMKRQLALTVGAVVVGAGSLALLTKLSSLWWNGAGLLLALGFGLTGLAVLPAVRRRAVREFRAKLLALRDQVRSGYLRAIAEEVDGARARLRRAWEPFLLFHRAEAGAAAERRREISLLRTELSALRDAVARLPAQPVDR